MGSYYPKQGGLGSSFRIIEDNLLLTELAIPKCQQCCSEAPWETTHTEKHALIPRL